MVKDLLSIEGLRVAVYPKHSHVAVIDLQYPRNSPPRVTTLEVGLEDVRAADSIQVSYDFDRDGWIVKQAGGWNRDQSKPGDQMDWQGGRVHPGVSTSTRGRKRRNVMEFKSWTIFRAL